MKIKNKLVRLLFVCVMAVCFIHIKAKAETIRHQDSIVVYLFLLDECRICQELMPEINQIFDEFNDKVTFIGVFPNFSSKQEGINKFKKNII